jgi:hypothetical protein
MVAMRRFYAKSTLCTICSQIVYISSFFQFFPKRPPRGSSGYICPYAACKIDRPQANDAGRVSDRSAHMRIFSVESEASICAQVFPKHERPIGYSPICELYMNKVDLLNGGRSVKKAFFFIITYFFKKVKPTG